MKLRPYRSDSVGRESKGYEFWCPGCGKTHYVITWANSRSHHTKVHEFNGDIEHPTFHPAVHTTQAQGHGEWIDDGLGGKLWIPTAREMPYCVAHVFNGTLRYTRSSGHYLAGQTIRMQPIPTTREHRNDMTGLSRQFNAQFVKRSTRAMVVVGIGLALTPSTTNYD